MHAIVLVIRQADTERFNDKPMMNLGCTPACDMEGTSTMLTTTLFMMTAILPLDDTTIRHKSQISAVTFSADGKSYATGSLHPECSVILWNTETNEPIRALAGNKNRVNALTFSPDGSLIASGAEFYGGNAAELIIWDTASGQVKHALRTSPFSFYSVAFAPNGRMLAASGDSYKIVFIDPATGKGISAIDVIGSSPKHLEWSRDGKTIFASGGGAFTIYDVATSKLVKKVEVGNRSDWATVSPDGKWIACNGNSVLSIFDAKTFKLARKVEMTNVLFEKLAWSHDSKWLAASDAIHSTYVLNAQTLQVKQKFETGGNYRVYSLAFNPKTNKLLGTDDVNPAIWSIE